MTRLKELAEAVQGWGNCTEAWLDTSEDDSAAVVGHIDEDGNAYPVMVVDCEQYYAGHDSLKLAKFYAAANPAAVLELLKEIESLRQQEEIAELRQQLADRDEQISDLTISSDTYFAERNSARDVWRRASKDRDELRQQLSAALAACKLKDEALRHLWNERTPDSYDEAGEALAIQPDDSALKAWLGEPRQYLYKFNSEFGSGTFWSNRPTHNGQNALESIPLYAPKGMK